MARKGSQQDSHRGREVAERTANACFPCIRRRNTSGRRWRFAPVNESAAAVECSVMGIFLIIVPFGSILARFVSRPGPWQTPRSAPTIDARRGGRTAVRPYGATRPPPGQPQGPPLRRGGVVQRGWPCGGGRLEWVWINGGDGSCRVSRWREYSHVGVPAFSGRTKWDAWGLTD